MGRGRPGAVLLGVMFWALAGRVLASDVDVSWKAPPDCSDREQLREALGRRFGREVTFGPDATLHLAVVIEAQQGGYEAALETRSPAGAESRRLQARSCGELVRTTLLIATLLLSAGPDPSSAAGPEPSAEAGAPSPWSLSARLRAVLDLNTLPSVALGPGIALGVALGPTRLELGGLWLPSQDVGRPRTVGRAQLLAGGAALCHELWREPSIAPCLQLEVGRLSARGEQVAMPLSASATWWLGAIGARFGLRLFGGVFLCAEALAGIPFVRPTLAIERAGVVHEVPALIGRFELGLEGRL